MGETFARHSPSAGPLLLAIGVAALAGLVSFLSPCVLPLVPGYLSYVTGLAGADLERRAAAGPTGGGAAAARRRSGSGARRHAAVRAGFTAVFVAHRDPRSPASAGLLLEHQRDVRDRSSAR